MANTCILVPPPLAAAPRPLTRHYDYLVELVCLSCSRPIGTAVVPSLSLRVMVPATIRCDACGGRPITSGQVARRCIDPNPMGPEDRPRVGRPPKWLVERRRQFAQ
jgi:hypothetical protein